MTHGSGRIFRMNHLHGNLHEDSKAGVNPMKYYGKKTVARYTVEIMEANR